MDREILWPVKRPDLRYMPEVCNILAKITEENSRQQYPKLWRITDKINAKNEKTIQPVSTKKQRRHKLVMGLVQFIGGLLLLIPGLVDRTEFWILAVGLLAWGMGMWQLWRYNRKVLVRGGFIAGLVLGVLGLVSVSKLGILLLPAAVCLIVAMMARRKPQYDSPFEAAAAQLLAQLPEDTGLSLTFSESGLMVPGQSRCGYEKLKFYETPNLLAITRGDRILLVSKSDLRAEGFGILRSFDQHRAPHVKLD